MLFCNVFDLFICLLPKVKGIEFLGAYLLCDPISEVVVVLANFAGTRDALCIGMSLVLWKDGCWCSAV